MYSGYTCTTVRDSVFKLVCKVPNFAIKFELWIKVERYRQVFLSFKELCSTGRQPSSFSAYCKANSVDQCQMRQTLKNEFQNIKTFARIPKHQSYLFGYL